jgi:hypothetical protein
MALVVSMTAASFLGLQVWRQLFNNFAVDRAGCGAFEVGIIQSVREIPGLLAFAAVYCLYLLKEHRLSAVSVLVMGVGLAITGAFPSCAGLVVTTLIMSFGFHYYEATNNSLVLQHFDSKDAPHVFGKQNSIAAFCNVIVAGLMWAVSAWCPFWVIYATGGALLVGVAIWAMFLKIPHEHLKKQHRSVVIRREYWLFYLLNVLCGARRQIFIVFSIFLLVKKFGFSLTDVSLLFIVNNLITWQVAPMVAKGVSRFGERKMLSIEYAALAAVFLGYALIDNKIVVAALYVVDNLFFGFSMALKTYFQKIARPEDIASSSAVSSTINHICAVILPVVGGYLWQYDVRIPFVMGAVLSLSSLVVVQWMRKVS